MNSNKLSEDVIRRIRETGDRSFFASIYKSEVKEFVRWAHKTFSCGEETARDVMQEVLYSLFAHIMDGRIKVVDNVHSYVFRAGKNKLIDWHRKHQKFSPLPEVERQEEAAAEEFVYEFSANEDEITLLYSCINELGDRCRELLLWVLKGNSTAETVKEMDFKNSQTLYASKNKCIARLKELIYAKKKNGRN